MLELLIDTCLVELSPCCCKAELDGIHRPPNTIIAVTSNVYFIESILSLSRM